MNKNNGGLWYKVVYKISVKIGKCPLFPFNDGYVLSSNYYISLRLI